MVFKWQDLQGWWRKGCCTILYSVATGDRRPSFQMKIIPPILTSWQNGAGNMPWIYGPIAWCRIIHLIAVPGKKENLRLAIGKAHRRYTHRINFREGWRGHFWQERFSSFVMDEDYLLACTRYIKNNPVRAKLVGRAEQCVACCVLRDAL